MNYEQQPDNSEDLFSSQPPLIRAASGKRLTNLLIDRVAFYLLLMLMGLLMGMVTPQAVTYLKSIADNRLLDFLITSFLYALFMSVQEAALGGKSLGKLITGTRAVMEDGTPLSTHAAFSRGLARIVPFEPFSALFDNPPHPWHDRWTNSMVIDEKS